MDSAQITRMMKKGLGQSAYFSPTRCLLYKAFFLSVLSLASSSTWPHVWLLLVWPVFRMIFCSLNRHVAHGCRSFTASPLCGNLAFFISPHFLVEKPDGLRRVSHLFVTLLTFSLNSVLPSSFNGLDPAHPRRFYLYLPFLFPDRCIHEVMIPCTAHVRLCECSTSLRNFLDPICDLTAMFGLFSQDLCVKVFSLHSSQLDQVGTALQLNSVEISSHTFARLLTANSPSPFPCYHS